MTMTLEQTLSIIKPDAVKDKHIGNIINEFENAGIKIVAMRMVHLTKEEAQAFYAVHKHRPFFGELVDYMISGPVVVMVLEGDNVIMKNREIMGATNPADAEPNTIRAKYGRSLDSNAVHGSDAPETAKTEVAFFFKPEQIHS